VEDAVTISTGVQVPARGGPVTQRIAVDDLSHVGAARRAADAVAGATALDETRRGAVNLVATEASTNLARHARDGVLFVQSTAPIGVAGVEVIAADKGPGMHDLERALTDGFTTGTTLGTGLGAIRRQADELDIYSVPGQGTILAARVFAAPERTAPRHDLLDIGAVCLPMVGETACGDGWAVVQSAERAVILLVDGLGHGPNAADAADTAIASFHTASSGAPAEIVAMLHQSLRSTRGAALAVAEVTPTTEGATVRYCGVGNTVAMLLSAVDPPRAFPSMNGTAGLQVRSMHEVTLPWTRGNVLTLHTDGITTRWRADAYRGILAHHPTVLATALQRDHTRGRDDATVLAFRLRSEPR
jgi:anti-sigma regulatory factor (Ser/Thr protein kinase)